METTSSITSRAAAAARATASLLADVARAARPSDEDFASFVTPDPRRTPASASAQPRRSARLAQPDLEATPQGTAPLLRPSRAGSRSARARRAAVSTPFSSGHSPAAVVFTVPPPTSPVTTPRPRRLSGAAVRFSEEDDVTEEAPAAAARPPRRAARHATATTRAPVHSLPNIFPGDRPPQALPARLHEAGVPSRMTAAGGASSEDADLAMWRALFASCGRAYRALWPDEVAALHLDEDMLPTVAATERQLLRCLTLTDLRSGGGSVGSSEAAPPAPTASMPLPPSPTRAFHPNVHEVTIDKKHALTARLGITDVVYRPASLALPSEYLVAMALAQLPDGRLLADPAAVSQWLAAAGAVLSRLHPSHRAVVEAGFRAGRLPSLAVFLPTRHGTAAAASASRHLSELADVTDAFSLLRRLVVTLYGPGCALDTGFAAVDRADSLRQYYSAFLSAGGDAERAASAVVAAFDGAMASWTAEATAAADLTLQRVLDEVPSRAAGLDVGQFIPLPAFTAHFPLVPQTATLALLQALTPAPASSSRARHQSDAAVASGTGGSHGQLQRAAGQRGHRSRGGHGTSGGAQPSSASADAIKVESVADVPQAIRAAITDKRFKSARDLMEAHPDAARLVHSPSGKHVCLRFAVNGDDRASGCTNAAACTRFHLTF